MSLWFHNLTAFLKKEDKNEGGHGWDNLLQEMQALFIAQGPSFKKALQVRPFHNVDLYNLMCVMIGINPAPNNGTWVTPNFAHRLK